MEKFSQWRDSSTGIAPFLHPVPALTSSSASPLLIVLKPFTYVLAFTRTTVVLALLLLHWVILDGLGLLLSPIPVVHKIFRRCFGTILCRLALFVMGFYWIPNQVVSLRRIGRSGESQGKGPNAGDLILANWSSYVDLLYLAFRYDPVIALPISSPVSPPPLPASRAPVSSPAKGSRQFPQSPQSPKPSNSTGPPPKILGFKTVSLQHAITVCGQPANSVGSGGDVGGGVRSLEDILSTSSRPVLVFPECTTSNNRALLRIPQLPYSKGTASSDKKSKGRIFLSSFRHDPPTSLLPSSTIPIPSSNPLLNPLPHLFHLLTPPFLSRTLSVRTLNPSESTPLPSSPLTGAKEKELWENQAEMLAQLGRLKRCGLAWDDKVGFLAFYRAKGKTR